MVLNSLLPLNTNYCDATANNTISDFLYYAVVTFYHRSATPYIFGMLPISWRGRVHYRLTTSTARRLHAAPFGYSHGTNPFIPPVPSVSTFLLTVAASLFTPLLQPHSQSWGTRMHSTGCQTLPQTAGPVLWKGVVLALLLQRQRDRHQSGQGRYRARWKGLGGTRLPRAAAARQWFSGRNLPSLPHCHITTTTACLTPTLQVALHFQDLSRVTATSPCASPVCFHYLLVLHLGHTTQKDSSSKILLQHAGPRMLRQTWGHGACRPHCLQAFHQALVKEKEEEIKRGQRRTGILPAARLHGLPSASCACGQRRQLLALTRKKGHSTSYPLRYSMVGPPHVPARHPIFYLNGLTFSTYRQKDHSVSWTPATLGLLALTIQDWKACHSSDLVLTRKSRRYEGWRLSAVPVCFLPRRTPPAENTPLLAHMSMDSL